mmetsp:Transcript_40742/g.103601  ORF Transcript_40742/g.103601 Transcript_40742/m.103601 type:complete len:142 (+) Transcript_40742:81-506(+)
MQGQGKYSRVGPNTGCGGRKRGGRLNSCHVCVEAAYILAPEVAPRREVWCAVAPHRAVLRCAALCRTCRNPLRVAPLLRHAVLQWPYSRLLATTCDTGAGCRPQEDGGSSAFVLRSALRVRLVRGVLVVLGAFDREHHISW